MESAEIVTNSVISAAPGWLYCEIYALGSEPVEVVDEYPVVAWAVRTVTDQEGFVASTCAYPVTADRLLYGNLLSRCVLRRPDGKYMVPEEISGTFDEVTEHMKVVMEREKQVAV